MRRLAKREHDINVTDQVSQLEVDHPCHKQKQNGTVYTRSMEEAVEGNKMMI